jgi:hypothetical protein
MLLPAMIMLLLLAAATAVDVDVTTVRCEATKDGGVGLDLSGYPQESRSNRGGSSAVQVKTYQEAAIFAFDLVALQGRRVLNATLHVHMSPGRLIVADVCTIAAIGWPEGTGTGRDDAAAGESSYAWMQAPGAAAPSGGNYWGGYVGSSFGDVTFANGGSLCSYAHHTNVSRGPGSWTAIRVAPALVEAMALDQDGLVLCDSSQLHNNTAVNTRKQSGAKPWLEVAVATSADSAASRPAAPPPLGPLGSSVSDRWNGEALVQWTQPEGSTFGYDVRWSISSAATPFNAETFDTQSEAIVVPRAQIPRPPPTGAAVGVPVRLWLQDLPPGQKVIVGVRPYTYGLPRNATAPSFLMLDLPPARGLETFVPSAWPAVLQKSAMPAIPQLVRIWAAEEYVKASPVTGNQIGRHYGDSRHTDDSWKDGNTVFGAAPGEKQASSSALLLRAARGEVVQAQIFVDNLQSTGSLRVSRIVFKAVGPSWDSSGLGAPKVARLWYAAAPDGEMYSSAVVPLETDQGVFGGPGITIPASDNIVRGQRNQGLWLSLFVPTTVAAGTYSAQLVFSVAGGTDAVPAWRADQEVVVPLSLTVVPISLPAAFSFALDLNSYSDSISENCGAGVSAVQCELVTQQLAHGHRHTANSLPYGQTGKLDAPFAPPLTGAGANIAVKSWNAFDARLGKFFDGTAFTPAHGYDSKTMPGGGVPLTDFYLPIFEGYPAKLSSAYQPAAVFDLFKSNRTAFTQQFRMMGAADPADAAVSPSYPEAFVAIVAQFKRHFEQRGWNRTKYQIYLNNKPNWSPNTGVWSLDEPVDFLDFVGLGYFMDLFRMGLGLPASPAFAGIQPPARVSAAPADDAKGGLAFDTRIDVSTRFVQHKGALNGGRISLADINGKVYESSAALIARRARQDNTTLWWYGADGSEGAGENERMEGVAGMLLAQWSRGCDGGLPWWESNGGGGKTNISALAITVRGTQWAGYAGAPLPSVRLKVALAGQQLMEALNALSAAPGWSRPAVARAVCAYSLETSSGGAPCATAVGGFGGLDLNALNYSSFSTEQLSTMRLRVFSTLLATSSMSSLSHKLRPPVPPLN